jgi:hypothetical protein
MKAILTLMTGTVLSAPNDPMCAVTGVFMRQKDPACATRKIKGKRIELISSGKRENNKAGYSMSANYWVEQKNDGDFLYIQMNLMSPQFKLGNSIELFMSF